MGQNQGTSKNDGVRNGEIKTNQPSFRLLKKTNTVRVCLVEMGIDRKISTHRRDFKSYLRRGANAEEKLPSNAEAAKKTLFFESMHQRAMLLKILVEIRQKKSENSHMSNPAVGVFLPGTKRRAGSGFPPGRV